MPRDLTKQEFLEVVERTPLVSIDFLIRDSEGNVLLGFRRQAPAKNSWFVPGGRIKKGEPRVDAMARILKRELKLILRPEDALFRGVYEHRYDDNVSENGQFGTHYVVLAYELNLDRKCLSLVPTRDHSDWKWLSVPALRRDECVHEKTRDFFAPGLINPSLYAVTASRRQAYDTLLWQTPALSLTAQAFLYRIILGGGTSLKARALASLLAGITAFASFQLMKKHRYYEKDASSLLRKFEQHYEGLGYEQVHVRVRESRDWITNLSSHKVWECLLLVFGVTSLALFFYCLHGLMCAWSFYQFALSQIAHWFTIWKCLLVQLDA